MTSKRQIVTVPGRFGSLDLIACFVGQKFAVTQLQGVVFRHRWTITHLKTGGAVANGLNQKHAIRACKLFEEHPQWSRVTTFFKSVKTQNKYAELRDQIIKAAA